MVEDPFIVAVFFGFVPAMGFLYILLREYQPFFSEKRMFRVFFIGMIGGGVVTLIELQLSPTALNLLGTTTITRPESVPLLGLFALVLGFLEAGAVAAVLNWKTFRGRRDTPFYGTAFGLGFGATNALFQMFFILRTEQEGRGDLDVVVQAILLAVLGLYFAGAILVHGAMGAWIGAGSAEADVRGGLLKAGLARGAFVALFYAMLIVREPPWASHALALLAIVAGIALIARVVNRVLDRVVPPEVLREMGIHQRRLARKFVRDEDEKAP